MGDPAGGRPAMKQSETMTNHSHSGQIEARLKTVRSRIRRAQRTRGAMVTATAVLGGLMAMMAVDLLFSPLPMALRWTMTGAWLVAVVVAARSGFGPMFQPIGLLQVARWLEGRHPEMEERLSTVLELTDRDGGVSPELMESLGRLAESDAAGVDAVAEVTTARTSRRWTRPALALLVLLGLGFAVWPGVASRLLVRAVAPFSALGSAGAANFKVTPGDLEVLTGDPVRIGVSYDGRDRNPEILMEMEDGTKVSQPMTQTDDGFRYVMDPARSGFRYKVRAGREESDGYTVTVWPLPDFQNARATLDFPEYTGVLPKQIDASAGIAAVAGTRVTLAGKTNTAIESASLEIGGKRVAEGRIESSSKGGRAEFQWNLTTEQAGEAVVTFKHRLGREVEVLRFPVEVLPDTPPAVVLLSPIQRDLKVRPDETLPLNYEITEDFSLAKLAVEVEADGKATLLLDEVLPAAVPNIMPPVFRGQAVVSIGDLRSRFPGVKEFRLRVRAEDGRPAGLGGPGVGHSEWVKLRVESGAESLARQELRQEHEGARKTIEEALRATRESREKMDIRRGEIRKPELDETARKDFKEAADKLAGAESKLKELASQMQESVHAAKADDVDQAADTTTKAREEMENALLQDDPGQRESKLDQARNDARDAERQLEAIRNQMDRDREKIEDLARMMELAQQQGEVARQAEEMIAKEDAADTLPDDWKQQQRQVEEAIKQQLRERPEARAEALKAQAEQAQALADQARLTAEAQQSLEEQTRETNPPEALAEEQAAQADAASELAREIETMPLVAGNGAMQEAKNDSTQGNRQAAEAAKKSQQGQPAEASQQHGESAKNFEKAVHSLEKAAEEFNRSAQEMASQKSNPQKAAVSPGDLAEAFEQASQAASNPEASAAAAQAASAAKLLASAAEAGRQSLQGTQPGTRSPPPGPPGNLAGDTPEEGPREPEPDPGVPPELAKLGITSDDWAKIQATLKSDTGAGEADAVPEEYRGLIKGYFESMSNKTTR
jgi:collagen type III alpha